MNYYKIYNQLILRAKKENRKKGEGVYYERHHIIPRCIGGTDDDDNLVLLTAREHFIVHKLLCEIHPNNKSLIYAYWQMCNRQESSRMRRNYNISSHEYDRVRQLLSEIVKNRKTGVSLSVETKRKMSQAKLGHLHTNDSKQRMRDAKIGKKRKPFSEETKKKMSESKLGKKLGPMSEEHKQKIREAKLNKKTQH